MKTERPKRNEQEQPDRKRVRTLIYLVAALMVPVVLYFGYDIARDSLFPCESIFRQAQASLTTKINFIGAKGEVQVGPEQVQELSERATMTALNLKTCCQVLEAGKLNSEQFLQCKRETRSYEANLEQVVKLVQATLEDNAPATGNGTDAAPVIRPEITAAVEQARNTSKAFNERVVELRKEQAIAQLEVTPPQNVQVDAQEQEPNSDILNTNSIALETTVTGAIADVQDNDYYVFTTPPVHRDNILIEIQNRSTTLRPYLYLYNSDKVQVHGTGSGMAGADIAYQFTSWPEQTFYVQVRNWNRETVGTYLLQVRPLRDYDSYEPNETILQFKEITLGTPVEAGIMDPHDNDYFVVKTSGTGGPLEFTLENQSTTLRPYFRFYSSSKVDLGGHGSGTAGADITYQIEAEPDSKLYVQVRSWNRETYGDYGLTVSQP